MRLFGSLGVLVIAVTLVPAFSVPPSAKRSAIIDGNLYFADLTVNRNRAQALAFCKGENGELAKINAKIYSFLRPSLATVGTYWIDGIDKPGTDRFELDTSTCTTANSTMDLSGIPEANLRLPSSTCLSLVKGSTAATSRIESIGCNTILRGVVCSLPGGGCDVTTTTTINPGK